MTKKVLRLRIIGSPYSGKTHLSKKIASKCNYNVCIDLDDIFWSHNSRKIERSNSSRIDEINKFIKKDSWITEGTFYDNWALGTLIHADLIVIIDIPFFLQILKAFSRYVSYNINPQKPFGDFKFKDLLKSIKRIYEYKFIEKKERLKILRQFENKLLYFNSYNSLLKTIT